MPMKTEIVPLLIVTKLEQYDYAGATAIALVMLLVSFVLLLAINLLQRGAVARVRRTACALVVAARTLASGSARWLLIGVALLRRAVPRRAAGRRVRRGVQQGRRGRTATAIFEPDTLAAIRLTLLVAAIAVPLNIVVRRGGGVAHRQVDFRGKSLLLTLIDLPFSVSPVISGLIFVLLFGAQRLARPVARRARHARSSSPCPGIVLATTFVTFPFVAREVLPVMQAQGNDEEEAALTLGASGWQTFFAVTLPKVSWGLLYGIMLCNARAMGEFGAVSVVSGHIRGLTNTLPLHVEILYNEYNLVGAFAVASLLTILGIFTLLTKRLFERRQQRLMQQTR